MEQNMTNNHITIGILAHVDAGKTTLSEAMLYSTGQIRSLGRVDHQDAYLDNDAQERERGITIFSKQARLDISRGTNAADTARTADVARTADTARTWHVVMLDTPGHVDFSAEMERTLQVLDYAILVISATDGVQGHTRTLWRLLKHYNVPTFIFVNKIDMQGTDAEKVQAELRSELSDGCVDFSSQDLFEELAMCSEPLLDEFMESGELADAHIAQAVAKREVFPCFYGSALKLDRVDTLIQGLSRFMCERNYPDEFSARVYKIGRDDRGSRLTFLKVTGGCLRVRDKIEYKAHGGDEAKGLLIEKIDQIRKYSGEKYETAEEVGAGGICAVTGLLHTFPGEGLGAEKASRLPVLEPVLTYQIILPEEVSPAVMLPRLRELEEEEPQLHIVWDETLKEIQVQVMGEVQIEVLSELIRQRYGVQVAFGAGRIVYKETIAGTVEGVGHFEPLRHYAEVHLLLEPGEPGSGLVFETDCSEDVLDRNWQRLVLTHLREKEHVGVLTGSALADMKITLVAGRAHTKHTEGGDFRQATYRALRQGLMQAETVLLEPWYDFRLSLPAGAVGRAMNDIDRMKGTITYSADGCIVGSAPVSTMQNYQREVMAYTAGEGKLSVALKGYFPCHNTEKVVAQIGYDAQSDLENTADSVFCAHGAGFIVPWDQVFSYMHLPPVLGQDKSGEEWYPGQWLPDAANFHAKTGEEEAWIGTEEIDRILDRTYNANKKDKDAGATNGYKKKRIIESSPVSASGGGKQKDAGVEYLLVDGYNVIFAWQELAELARVNMDSARGRLLDILCNYQGIRRCELIVVFDA